MTAPKKSFQPPISASTPSKDALPFTKDIHFLGVGVDDENNRYLVLKVKDKRVVMRVDNLSTNRPVEMKRLEREGVSLISSAAQTEFINRAQREAGKSPRFQVITKTGWNASADGSRFFLFPDAISDAEDEKRVVYLDPACSQIRARFRVAGSDAGVQELLGLFKGNSRLIFGAALCLVPPTVALFGGESVNAQFTGLGGGGKTSAGTAISSIWGWDPNPDHKLGFGTSWLSTLNGLEPVMRGYNHTLAFFNETRLAPEEGRSRWKWLLDAIMKGAEGQGKTTAIRTASESFLVGILSTSNVSVMSMLNDIGIGFDPAYIDRLFDIPAPAGGVSFFEDLRGFPDVGSYCVQLIELSAANHGLIGRHYTTALAKAFNADEAEIVDFYNQCREYYISEATAAISAQDRDLTRTHGKFATVYATGRLAAEFGSLPFTDAELFDAVFTCERDHVDFVQRERGKAVHVGTHLAIATQIDPSQISPLERLNSFTKEKKRSFIDLTGDGSAVRGEEHPVGYIAVIDGHREYWLANRLFDQIVGGKKNGESLKRELLEREQIATEARGKARSFVVKRDIPGKGRQYVVALRPRTGVATAQN
jgi:hypothetical protein